MSKKKRERWFSQKQYDLLEKCAGTKDMSEWNAWRDRHPKLGVYLEQAALVGAYLRRVNLRKAHLGGAHLWQSNLEEADLKGARLEGARGWGANLKKADLKDACIKSAIFSNSNLERANFYAADLEEVDFNGANLSGALVMYANLNRADLSDAQLDGANLSHATLSEITLERASLVGAFIWYAQLNGSYIRKARLEGVYARVVSLDGRTLLEQCTYDLRTDFGGAPLDACRIDPGLKQNLEYNIRRIRWEKWYGRNLWLRHPVAWFWLVSDYGRSTWRVLGVFLWLSLFFGALYENVEYFAASWGWFDHGLVSNLHVDDPVPWRVGVLTALRPLYFSIVTMTTLGFGDIHADRNSILGHVCLVVQVLLGYGLLGALVTRFAVMFTAGGPAEKYRPVPSSGTHYLGMLKRDVVQCVRGVGRWVRGGRGSGEREG